MNFSPRLVSALALTSLFLGLPSCASKASESPFAGAVEVTDNDMTISCDPNGPPPGKIGEQSISIDLSQFPDLDPATVEIKIVYDMSGPVRFNAASGTNLVPGPNTLDVIVTDCNFSEYAVDYDVVVTGKFLDSREDFSRPFAGFFTVRNTFTGAVEVPPETLAREILGTPVVDFRQYLNMTPTGVPRRHSSGALGSRIPDLRYTETFAVGALVTDLDATQIENAFTGTNPTFPVGEGPHGLTLAPEDKGPMPTGRYLFAWQCVEESIPRSSPTEHFQFAYVGDRDGVEGNNYRGAAPFMYDLFDNTDTWYSAEYAPANGWALRVSDAQNGTVTSRTSGARVIIYSGVQFFVIPVEEFNPGLMDLSGRFTTFAHEGDYGLSGGPWSTDTSPPVDEPRYSISLSASF